MDQLEKEHILKERGIRPTAMRVMILQYLMKADHATSLNELEQNFDRSDKSTLYRTLKTFEDNKMVHKIDDGSGIFKYGLCEENCECAKEDQHFHFHCEKCEETFCLNSMHIPNLKLPKGFTLKQANLVLKGVCSYCNPVA